MISVMTFVDRLLSQSWRSSSVGCRLRSICRRDDRSKLQDLVQCIYQANSPIIDAEHHLATSNSNT